MIAIMDTETTGLTKPPFAPISEQPYVIEVGIVFVENGEIVEEFDQLFKPPIPLTAEREKMHDGQITNAILEDKPAIVSAIPILRDRFGKCSMMFGHNITFDYNVMKYEFLRSELDYFPWPETVIDTVHEFRHLFGFNPKLAQLYEKVIGKPIGIQHRALADAKSVYEILKKKSVI